MKAFEITGPKACQIVDVDIPTPGDDDAVMKMLGAGICASDVHFYEDGGFFGSVTDKPARLGHEGIGRITSVGSAVKKHKVGDYVTFHCALSPKTRIGIGGDQGCFAEYLLVRDADISLFSVGENVPSDVAAQAEPLSVSIGIVNAGEPQPGQKIVTFGAGPIGLGAIVWLKLCGVASVVVIEAMEARRQKALEVGADAALDPSDNVAGKLIELHGPSRYPSHLPAPKSDTDIYYDLCGVGPAVEQAVSLAHRAKIIVGGMHSKPVPIDFMAMLMGANSIQMGGNAPEHLVEAAAQLTKNPKTWAPLIHRPVLPFAEVEKGLKIVSSKESIGKVVLTFDSK